MVLVDFHFLTYGIIRLRALGQIIAYAYSINMIPLIQCPRYHNIYTMIVQKVPSLTKILDLSHILCKPHLHSN